MAKTVREKAGQGKPFNGINAHLLWSLHSRLTDRNSL